MQIKKNRHKIDISQKILKMALKQQFGRHFWLYNLNINVKINFF